MIEILQKGNKVLTKKAKPVTNYGSKDLIRLIDEMFQVMYEYKGVGLAAPQIGQSIRLFVYGIKTLNPRYPDVGLLQDTVIINPEILWASSETTVYPEKCLSVPNTKVDITRLDKIKISYYTVLGEKVESVYSGFESRIIQHELDHLDGILIKDLIHVNRYSSVIN